MWAASWAGMGVGLAIAPLLYYFVKSSNKASDSSEEDRVLIKPPKKHVTVETSINATSPKKKIFGMFNL